MTNRVYVFQKIAASFLQRLASFLGLVLSTVLDTPPKKGGTRTDIALFPTVTSSDFEGRKIVSRSNFSVQIPSQRLHWLSTILAIVSVGLLSTSAQTLSLEEATTLALQHNYDIQLAQKSVEAADNNASIYNTGFLPTANLSGNGTINYNAGENETSQGTSTFDATDAYQYGASVGISYTIFNGLGRKYNYKSLKEQHNLTELQAQQIIEQTMVQLSSAYYQIAQLSENVSILENAKEISKIRLKRAQYAFEYGQGSQLNILNAEVDVNNDSINLLNTLQQLDNAKRNLNLILGRKLDESFSVDTAVTFNLALSADDLNSKAQERNNQIQQTQSQLRNSEFAIKAGRSGWFPSLSANAAYAYSGNKNSASPFLQGSQTYGPQAGLSLSWNIFDGGGTKTRVQGAKIQLETQKLQQEKTIYTVERDVLNAHASYQNALFVLKAQQDNLATAKRNFDRSNEMYKNGQITSIEFRTAQLNMLNAQSSVSQAKYSAKNAELQLKQLAGILSE
ncbi:MAG: outer membrane protein [Bacteroidia bacterium]|jgi:outer membrane protein